MKRSWVLMAVLSFALGALVAYWTPSISSAVAAEQSAGETTPQREDSLMPVGTAEPARARTNGWDSQGGAPSRLVDRQPKVQGSQTGLDSATDDSAPTATPAAEPARNDSPLPSTETVITPAEPAARTYTLETGSTVQVRTTNALSTKMVAPGEGFTASLAEPIVDGGWVIAPKGATALGKVVAADKGGRVKGRAKLAIELTELVLPDGEHIAIRTNPYAVEANASVKKDAAKVGIGAGVGAIIGAIAGGGSGAAKGAGVGAGAAGGMVLATHGEDAVIPSESVLSFTLAEPVTFSR